MLAVGPHVVAIISTLSLSEHRFPATIVNGDREMTDLTVQRPNGLNETAANIAGGLQRPALAPIWLVCVAICVDMPVFATALWFAQYASLPDAIFSPVSAALTGILAALVLSLTLAASSSYDPWVLRNPLRSILRTFLSCVAPVGAVVLTMPNGIADDLLVAAIASLTAVTVPIRIGSAALAKWMINNRLFDRRAVIAGGGEHAMHLVRGLSRRPGNGIRLLGIFDDRDDARSPSQILGVPKIGSYDDLITFVRASEIDMVIISLPLHAEARIEWLLKAFKVLPVEIRLSAYSQNYALEKTDRDPLVSAIRRSFSPECRLTKRVFDIVLALFILILFSPLMVLVALAIRLESKGPVFFKQKRHGYNERIISVLKFRSMYHDQADPEARRVVTRGDPRVTRVGRFLRRSSIDELPQLFNVLRGDLSLVGPRPHAVDAISSQQERFTRIVDGYSARHRLPPGITGWSQVNGLRGEIDDPVKLTKRVEYDLTYIENWSFWLDLRILLLTPFSLFKTDSAY